jgi:hypothetical protein
MEYCNKGHPDQWIMGVLEKPFSNHYSNDPSFHAFLSALHYSITPKTLKVKQINF